MTTLQLIQRIAESKFQVIVIKDQDDKNPADAIAYLCYQYPQKTDWQISVADEILLAYDFTPYEAGANSSAIISFYDGSYQAKRSIHAGKKYAADAERGLIDLNAYRESKDYWCQIETAARVMRFALNEFNDAVLTKSWKRANCIS